MAIAVRINTQNQQKVRTLSPISSTTLINLSDISAIDLTSNNTLVYNQSTSKFEVKALPIINGGTF